VGEIPSNILLTRIRPSIYIPSLQVRTPYLQSGYPEIKSTDTLCRSSGQS
jgi:hypothetical protein